MGIRLGVGGYALLYGSLAFIGLGAVQAVTGIFGEQTSPGFKQTTSERPSGVTPDGAVRDGWNLPTAAKIGTAYRQPGSAWASGYHTGVDFLAPSGTPVMSVGNGQVISAGWGGKYGNQVVIRHRDGVYSQYAHLSRLNIRTGDSVSGGQEIGLTGATGNAFGPHLHFEVRTGPGYGSDINPVNWLRKHGVNV